MMKISIDTLGNKRGPEQWLRALLQKLIKFHIKKPRIFSGPQILSMYKAQNSKTDDFLKIPLFSGIYWHIQGSVNSSPLFFDQY